MPTLKQIYKAQFFKALDEYRAALQSKDAKRIIVASVHIHSAKGYVPKGYWPLVNRAYREN